MAIWPAIMSPPHVKFLAWGTSSSLPTPMSSHGRAAMAMAMSLATFYRAWPWPWPYVWPWPWPYVGVSYFFGGLYLHAMRYQSAGGPAPPPLLTLHFWPGGTSPPRPRPRVVMAICLATFYRASPWPWPRFTEAPFIYRLFRSSYT